MTEQVQAVQSNSIIAIHEGDKELTAPEGHMVIMVRGNSKAGRAAKQVIVPEFDLGEVPEVYRGMLKENLLGEVRNLVKGAKGNSILESQVSALALATEWNSKNVEVDWASAGEILGKAMEAFLKETAPTFPAAKIGMLIKGKLAQFKMFVTGIKAGQIDQGIWTAINATLAKLVGWDNLLTACPDALGVIEMVEKMSAGVEIITAEDLLG